MAEDDRVEELEEKVEELTEELERVKNRKTGAEKQKEVGEIQDQIKDAAEDSGISRRKFMKMIGGGAAGLSAAAVLPSVSGFTFKDDSSFKFGNMSSSQTNMEVGTGGDLDMHGNDITNIGGVKGDGVIESDIDNQSVSTNAGDIGSVYVPDAEDDLPQFVSDHAGEVIDLAGQTFEPTSEIDIPSNTKLRNGTIRKPSGSGTYAENALISTPPDSDRSGMVIENIRFDGEGNVDAIRINDSGRYSIRNTKSTNVSDWHIDLYGKLSSEAGGVEGNGVEITAPRIEGIEGNGSGGIRLDGVDGANTDERDYAEVNHPIVRGTDRAGVYMGAENTTLFGGHVTGCGGTQEPAQVYGDADKLKVHGTTINHSPQDAIYLYNTRKSYVQDVRAIIADRHLINAPTLKWSSIRNCTLGKANANGDGTGSCIHIGTTDETGWPGPFVCHNNHLAVDEFGDDSVYAIDSTGIGGMCSIRNNVDHGSQNGFDVRTNNVGGNQPAITFDSEPNEVANYVPTIATSAWDPNGNGTGAVVMTDDGGSTWQDIITLPNT